MQLPRLTAAGERVLARATHESSEMAHRYLGVEHLFLGIAHEAAGTLGEVFGAAGCDLDATQEALRGRMQSLPANPTTDFLISPRCRRVFQLAARTPDSAVGPAELLSAIVREGRSVPVRVLRTQGLDPLALESVLAPAPEATPDDPPADTPLLNLYGRDLTALARDGRLSPVIGRQPEMSQLSEVLLRRNKNNPLLIGEAGVGKTAVVEGLAQRLVAPDCPEPLRDRRLVEVSLGALVAGTKFRGEFEERLLGLLKEVQEHADVILFLDEIHTLVGAGSTGGGDAMDASNIAKPALARGEMRCIGATTIDEYRRHFEKDPALERRFECVQADEPTPAEALEILTRLTPTFEAHHGVTILPEAVQAAVSMTAAHVPDRQLPDKALDAIDQACASRRLERYTRDEPGDAQIGADDVARTVAQWTGIPLERLSGAAARGLLNLEGDLLQHVLGQDAAVRVVSRQILTARAGLADPSRPTGVFLFTGPTGVGKTHLAKSLASALFGLQKRFVRVDMSEYMEEHSVAKLVGSPPGYVGHEQEGVLISALRTHPHCVVLLDEIEKAHPRVLDLFLQVFDEGCLTGAKGRRADFTQAVVIMTSNIDVRPPPSETPVGFGREAPPAPTAVDPRTSLQGWMRPEIINRLDAVIPFQPLGDEALLRIIEGYIDDVRTRLAERRIELDVGDDVAPALLALGDTDRYGARELNRVVDRTLRQPLAPVLVEHGDRVGRVCVTTEGHGLHFEVAEAKQA